MLSPASDETADAINARTVIFNLINLIIWRLIAG